MRVRKIHAVVAASVALVLVARSIEGRRRAQDGLPAEPVGDLPSEGHVGSMTAEPVSLTECEAERSAVVAATADAGTPGGPEPRVAAEGRPSALEQPAGDPEVPPEAEQVALEAPVALRAEFRSEAPPASASPEVESDAASTGKRRHRRGRITVAAAVIVLIAVLAGTVVGGGGRRRLVTDRVASPRAVVADRAEFTIADTKRVPDALEEVVLEELSNAQRVRIGGLVQLTVRVKSAQKKRPRRNPAAGEQITIAAKPASVDVRARVLAPTRPRTPDRTLQIRIRAHHLRLDPVRASELQTRRRRVSRQQPRLMSTLGQRTRGPQQREPRAPQFQLRYHSHDQHLAHPMMRRRRDQGSSHRKLGEGLPVVPSALRRRPV